MVLVCVSKSVGLPCNPAELLSEEFPQQDADRRVGHKELGFPEVLTDKLNTKSRGNLSFSYDNISFHFAGTLFPHNAHRDWVKILVSLVGVCLFFLLPSCKVRHGTFSVFSYKHFTIFCLYLSLKSWLVQPTACAS